MVAGDRNLCESCVLKIDQPQPENIPFTCKQIFIYSNFPGHLLWFHPNLRPRCSLVEMILKALWTNCHSSHQKTDKRVHWQTELYFVRIDISYNSNKKYCKRSYVFGERKIVRENGCGSDLCVRPLGRGMLNTLHPGKGSLRSSGPICSRRGKWHIIGSRPDKGSVYITLPDTRLT